MNRQRIVCTYVVFLASLELQDVYNLTTRKMEVTYIKDVTKIVIDEFATSYCASR